MIVDITPIFYDLIENIVSLEYKDLIETKEMIELANHVREDNEFMIFFDGSKYYHFETVDDLFFGSLKYCRKNGLKDEFEMIQTAIERMKTYINIEEKMDDVNDIISKMKF